MTTPPDPRHKEAFALMWYGCDCGHRERIWNSRDGVTPFCSACPSCGRPNLRHVDWRLDQTATNYRPNKGQRVWRDGTADEAADLMTKRLSAMVSQGYEINREEAALLIEQAREGSGASDFRRGWPILVTVMEKGVVP